LRLENIGLKTLPGTLANLGSLDELALRNNRLTSIPNSFEKLSKLRHLDLRGNRFTRIPEVVRALPTCKNSIYAGTIFAAFHMAGRIRVSRCRVLL